MGTAPSYRLINIISNHHHHITHLYNHVISPILSAYTRFRLYAIYLSCCNVYSTVHALFQVLCAYCDVAPPVGGETPLAISNVVYRMMAEREPEFVERLAKEGLCYTRIAPEETDESSALGRSWKSTFFADDRETAQLNAQNAGFTVEWMPDGSMKYTTAPLQAIRVDPRTGATLCAWFRNGLHYVYDRRKTVLSTDNRRTEFHW